MLLISSKPDEIDPDEYTTFIDETNKQIIQRNVYLLTDNPKIKETNHGISVQQGKYVITFVQYIDKLKEASKLLHSTSYYDNWEPEFYDEVVGKRKKIWDKYKNE